MESEWMECDSTSPEIDPELAEQRKSEGNTAYTLKQYSKAIQCYTQAISHNPNCASFYGNRAAAYMMLDQYKNALSDAQKSISIDDGFVKGYLRAAKCQLMLGNPDLSLVWYNKVLTLQPRNTQVVEEKRQVSTIQFHLEKANQSFEKEEYRTCIYHMDRCLDISQTCVRFKTLKAEALAMSGKLDDSVIICHDIIRGDSNNCDAIFIKGLCLYYQDDTTRAHQFFQNVLRVDPDHTKARHAFRRSKQLMLKKEEGNEAFRSSEFQKAYDLYTEALSIDPKNIITNAKLYCNRGLMAQKMGDFEKGIEDCSRAIELDQKYLRAYQRRATLYQQAEQYEECVRDWKKVCEMDRTTENRQSLKEAEKQLKLSKRKDYYKILGIEKNVSQDEIKKAYRKKAMLHHPDRHSSADVSVREQEEQKFKEVSEAYSVLSDLRKKSRYDNGQDLDDMGMDIDPNEMFSTFFGGFPMEMGFSSSGFSGFSSGRNTFTFFSK